MNRLPFPPGKEGAFLNQNEVGYLVFMEDLKPFVSNKLTICHQGVNAMKAEDLVKDFKQINPFTSV